MSALPDDVVPLPDTVVPGLDNVVPDDVIIVLGDVLMLGMSLVKVLPPAPLPAPPTAPAVVCAWSVCKLAASSFQALIPFKMLTISRARAMIVA